MDASYILQDRIVHRIYLTTVFLHIFALCLVFPVTKLATKDLPYHIDYSLWLYNSLTVNQSLHDSWQMWGYDPHVNAGYPDGGVALHPSTSARGWELFTYLFSKFSFPLGFKLYPFLCILLVPLILRQACKVLELGAVQTDLVTSIALLYWWASELWDFSSTGMISFVTAVSGTILIFAYFVAFCRSKSTYDAIELLFVSILFLWVHPFTPFMVALPIFIFYIYSFRELSLRQHATLAVVAILIALSTLPWTYSAFLIHYRPSAVTIDRIAQSSGWRGIIKHLFGPNGRIFLAVLGSIGLREWYRTGRKGIAIAWSCAIVWIAFMTYFGSKIPHVNVISPARFLPVMYLYLCFPAGEGLIAFIRWFRTAALQGTIRIALLALLCLSFGFNLGHAAKRMFYNPIVEGQRIVTPISPEAKRLIRWIQENTTKEGRILFEEWIRWESDYNIVPGLIALETDREFVGAVYWDLGRVYQIFERYEDGILFNRRIDSISVGELVQYLDLYNIHWVVCWDSKSIQFFENHPELFRFQANLDPVRVFSVLRPCSFFVKGNGVVHSTFNRLEIKNIRGEELILKYHWIPTLKSNDHSPVYEVKLLNDPNGFIGLRPKHEEVTLYNSYRLDR